MEKRFLTWEYIELAVDRLVSQIAASNTKIKNITGMKRGGLIPAVMLSHKMNIPYIDKWENASTLIVDDICDSGETLKRYKYPCLTATIHTKKTAIIQPTFWYEVVENEWIVYPWERNDSQTIADYKI
jgi:hypothetical protein